MQVDRASADARVTLLGREGAVGHGVDAEKHLVIHVPDLPADRRPCEHAFAFRLTGFDVSLSPDARFTMPGAVTVPPGKVTLEGTKVRVQDVGGRPNIGAWDNPKEKCHWLVWLRQAGTWAVRGEFTSANGPSGLTMRLAGATRTAAIPKTDGWFKQVWVDLGTVTIPEPGVYHLTLEPADADAWKPVNVWNLQLAPAK